VSGPQYVFALRDRQWWHTLPEPLFPGFSVWCPGLSMYLHFVTGIDGTPCQSLYFPIQSMYWIVYVCESRISCVCVSGFIFLCLSLSLVKCSFNAYLSRALAFAEAWHWSFMGWCEITPQLMIRLRRTTNLIWTLHLMQFYHGVLVTCVSFVLLSKQW